MSDEIVHNYVGKCAKCGKLIDNAVEGYFTDSKGNIYCEKCYAGE
jgi:hypothetical protein